MPLRLLLVAVLTALLAGCSPDGTTPGATPSGPTTSADAPAAPDGPRLRYVALGDSFTAAPGLEGSSLPCFRSTANYPALVAAALGETRRVDLDDRSCIGADTSTLAGPQELAGARIPAQAAGLDRRTDVVTLSMGGNDDGFFTRLLTGCLGLAASPDEVPCDAASLVGGLDTVRQRLVDAVADLRERAPRAQVVLVGYPMIVPERGSCAGLPDDAGDRAVARTANEALVDVVAQAAAESGATYVDVARASRGHELCSDDPWVNGTGSDPSGAFPFHPLPAEQQAVADLVVEAVRG